MARPFPVDAAIPVFPYDLPYDPRRSYRNRYPSPLDPQWRALPVSPDSPCGGGCVSASSSQVRLRFSDSGV